MMSRTPRTFIGWTTYPVHGMTCAHCRRAATGPTSLSRSTRPGMPSSRDRALVP